MTSSDVVDSLVVKVITSPAAKSQAKKTAFREAVFHECRLGQHPIHPTGCTDHVSLRLIVHVGKIQQSNGHSSQLYRLAGCSRLELSSWAIKPYGIQFTLGLFGTKTWKKLVETPGVKATDHRRPR